MPKDEIVNPYVSRKGERELASIEDCVDTTIQGFEAYMKKSK